MNALVYFVNESFTEVFKEAPSHLIQAPGRVNLIGEHTDYNDGFVLPCAINYQTVIAARKRDDNLMRVVALDYGSEMDEFDVSGPIHHEPNKMWANYIRGVVLHIRQRGFQFGGADLVVSGNIPQGTGLSSSASLEVAVGKTMTELYALGLDNQSLALIGQEAENQFVGCNCGIMDQLISAKGEEGSALLIDCRSLETQPIHLPSELTVLIVNSNKSRGLVDSEYNTRREQCEAAAAFFNVKALRDVTIEQLENAKSEMDDVVYRRAKHIITENARTLAASSALKQGNVYELSELMRQSHLSMKDDFEITVPEIDFLVDKIDELIGHNGGVRMTGGGFGGCVIALVPESAIQVIREKVLPVYYDQYGLQAELHVCSAQVGTSLVDL
ncbi:galactokinase [Vibrio nigripulchritudo ATCC 27043]|uniref:galactokinase n=1 Tax=Vibrio nigripulchritudo TaxID=28173 RepID=UPI00021C2304|nr:galactokinase [Vibrio nigripulchritudo]EGU57410.1 galactokinase [Vibrio nigripulchritudo ATCC 27043]